MLSLLYNSANLIKVEKNKHINFNFAHFFPFFLLFDFYLLLFFSFFFLFFLFSVMRFLINLKLIRCIQILNMPYQFFTNRDLPFLLWSYVWAKTVELDLCPQNCLKDKRLYDLAFSHEYIRMGSEWAAINFLCVGSLTLVFNSFIIFRRPISTVWHNGI